MQSTKKGINQLKSHGEGDGKLLQWTDLKDLREGCGDSSHRTNSSNIYHEYYPVGSKGMNGMI